METKYELDELIEKGEQLIYRLLAKMGSKPKYLLGHTLADKYKIESLEERLKVWGFNKTESGLPHGSQSFVDCISLVAKIGRGVSSLACVSKYFALIFPEPFMC